MSFERPITIAEALSNVERRGYLLPAIQREFIWPASKIEWLFDSLMRGYPQLDYRNNDFHKDHLHPISSFDRDAIEKMGLDKASQDCFLSSEWNNSIVNL